MKNLLMPVIIFIVILQVQSGLLSGETWEQDKYEESARKSVRQPLSCTCNDEICNCCAKFEAPKFKSSHIGCVQITRGRQRTGYLVGFNVNGTSVWKKQFTGKMIPPLCIPIPQIPLIQICLVIRELGFENGVLHMCPKLEVRIFPGMFTLLVISLDCIEIRKDGITFLNSGEPSEFLGIELNRKRNSGTQHLIS